MYNERITKRKKGRFKMKKKIKAILAMSMAVCMLAACGNVAEKKEESTVASEKESNVAVSTEIQKEESKYPDYLNLDGFRPIVKNGEEVTLKVATYRATGVTTDINETWFVKFIEEKLNINLEIEELTSENRTERTNLMLASGDIPDLFLVPLTNGEVVEYGVNGGELLPISDYLSEELTPNICAVLDREPEAKEAATASDGKIYSVPKINSKVLGEGDSIGIQRVFIDKVYMEKAGVKEIPNTVDEFVDMLRAFKEIDPAELGVNEFWPLIPRSNNDRLLFMNAFGWVAVDQNQATAPVLDVETNEVVVPCLTEKYADFIRLYHTLYSEGLIHPDMFTLDKAAARALYAEGKAGVNTDFGPHLFNMERYTNDEFVLAKPLSSEFIKEPICTVTLGYTKNIAFVSADTEYPEVCVRLLDYLYSEEGANYSNNGPMAGSEDCMDMVGGYYLKEDGTLGHVDVDSGKFETSYQYNINMIKIHNDVNQMDVSAAQKHQYEIVGGTAPTVNNVKDAKEYYNTQNPYLVYPLADPYMDSKTNTEYTDLMTVLENYHDQEFAKFVVGQRPIEEVDKLYDELMALGGKEYLEIIEKVYGK